MLTQNIVINNRLGLHVKAAVRLTEIASLYNCDIHISKGAQRVNAKSIMGVMMLAAEFGTMIKIEVTGIDADSALKNIENFFLSRFEEK